MVNMKSFFTSIMLLCVQILSAQTDSNLESIRESYKKEEYKSLISKYADKTKKLNAKEIYYVGMSYYMLEDDENALKYLSASIEKGPADFDMYYYRGMTLYYMKRYNEALPDINNAIDMLPDEMDFYLGKSKVYSALEKTDSAILTLETAFQIDSSNIQILDELAFLLSETKNYDRAIHINNCVLKNVSENSNEYKNALYNVGLFHLLLGQADKAEPYFISCVAKFPKYYDAIPKLIQCLYVQKKYTQSEPYKKQLYELHKKNALPKSMEEMFCFDQFYWKDKLVMAFEYFEVLDNGFKTIKYRFFVTDGSGNIEYWVQSESSAAVKLSEGDYILAVEKNNNHFSYWSYKFNDLSDYDALKVQVFKILNEEIQPDASTIRK